MRISQLPLVNNPSTTDDLPIDRNGVTYRVKYQALRGPQGEPGTDGQDGTIENLNVTATTLAPGSSATATYANNLLTLGIPRGNTGATGNGISSIQKTSTVGLVDTYTITMTDGSTATFTVTNGGGSITVDTAMSYSSTNPVQNKVITAAMSEIVMPTDNYLVESVWTQSTWSQGAVANGAPSGGTCYKATYSNQYSDLDRIFAPDPFYSYYDNYLYVTPLSGQIMVETVAVPIGGIRVKGHIVKTGAMSSGFTTRVGIDSELSATSPNPVQNKVVTEALLERVYPVGSIYMSVNSTNPGTLFGGTWVSFGEGRVLVGVDANDTDFNAAQKTGGEKAHTLTEDELPNITGDIQTFTSMTTFRGGIIYDATGAFSPHANPAITHAGRPTESDTTTAYATVDFDIGGDQPHNNMPPYITCYMWRRTA